MIAFLTATLFGFLLGAVLVAWITAGARRSSDELERKRGPLRRVRRRPSRTAAAMRFDDGRDERSGELVEFCLDRGIPFSLARNANTMKSPGSDQ